MNVRAIVVDDEEPARGELCFQLGRLEYVAVAGEARDGDEALRLIEAVRPDLVLLDIQMPGQTGFEVARELVARRIETEVVFVTAYDQYAIEAFEVNAVDYLLKPIDPDRLAQAIGRVRSHLLTSRMAAGGAAALREGELERIAEYMTQRPNRRSQVAVRCGDRFLLVQADDIVYASLADDVITVAAGSLLGTSSCRTLDELQTSLDPAVFWRVHRSHLVNINKIKEVVPWFSRNYILKMKDPNGTEIPVSRAQTRRLRNYLKL
jgi:two-component system LytT family response regulator/two-component system response regulator LytT